MFGYPTCNSWRIGAAVAIVLAAATAARIHHQSESAGASGVAVEVQKKTIGTIDAGRISTEKTDAGVHSTPYSDRVDGLR